jgi:hypothetical protein
MSILKARRLPLSNKPGELEGSIRELMRRESSVIGQAGENSEQAAGELASLVQRISGGSIREIDHLISGLTNLRQKLDDAATRIQSDIIEFASLSQSVMQLTKIVSDGVTQVARVSDASGIASESPHPSDTAAVVREQQNETTAEPAAC